MEQNTTSSKELPKYDKNNIEQSLNKFQTYILNNINDMSKLKNTLLNLSLKGKADSELMSSFSLKIYLNALSTKKESTLKTWLEETLSQRNKYKDKLKNMLQINQFKGDPLGGGENGETGGWNNFFDKKEIKDLINLDVERTFQERDLFREASIKEIEYNVLFLFAENNQPISYKQGMCDILAMLIFTLYPYYIKADNKNYNEETFEKWANDPINNIKDIYSFFNDEDEFQSDLYYLLNNIMKLGVNKFYEEIKDKNKDKETFAKSYLIKRCDDIFDRIKTQNNKLYFHFINNKLDCNLILIRWIKCLFIREFHPKDCIVLWDIILANEAKNPSGELLYIDNFCIAMIDFISEELLKSDQNECFTRLFNYPPLETIDTLLSLAEKIKSNKSDTSTSNNNIKEQPKTNPSKKLHSGSMADFLYSSKNTNKPKPNNTTNNNTININKQNNASALNNTNNTNKKPNLMFGGDYSSNKKSESSKLNNNNKQTNNQQAIHKKVPMFGDINKNAQVQNKNNTKKPPASMPTFVNTRAYHVSNEENIKMLDELKGLIDYYIKEFSNEDKMKIGFLMEKLRKEL